jgi:Ca2+ transporting ATPase
MGILIVAIPEGLPVALTISLAFSSERMSKEQNLVKTLDSCETMGSATTICTDKTGTLTANRMTVRGVYMGDKLFPASSDTSISIAKPLTSDTEINTDMIKQVAELMAICTMDTSGIRPPGENEGKEWIYQGNPTECSLLKFCQELSYDYEDIRKKNQRSFGGYAGIGQMQHVDLSTEDDVMGCAKAWRRLYCLCEGSC